jgi:hypothetical protein
MEAIEESLLKPLRLIDEKLSKSNAILNKPWTFSKWLTYNKEKGRLRALLHYPLHDMTTLVRTHWNLVKY